LERTRNEKLVYDYLDSVGKPTSAYVILDALREDGLRAPLQVYRALGKLIDQGAVHRIESLNAFVACKHLECNDNRVSIFMLCNSCEEVAETVDAATASALEKLCEACRFNGMRQVIEISGTCQTCQQNMH
jgi:Fur family zinc uptake transcriptional regulator